MDSGSALSWPFYNMWLKPAEENDSQPDNEVGNHTGIGDVLNKPISQIWPRPSLAEQSICIFKCPACQFDLLLVL